ncbi:bifunctional phosphopantothenoylcysteine decarboxylase/phosphopantothenate--cysteine ligase CoaBC [Acidiphilium acidophilum]|uniref:bifunctional phosphopantothenoylcysteine decarboxylase/phosphopantothenate--cysteine ligase CoaBC n=1 Tax=Acidiphilium acidophilum TaxID=76588 RepID=UPI002E8E6D88|nr:bifunctional phosphopantothenoylcysteine decarboxylase/phosphopantothenate--cysteine ligase CoaBC [Acidiphilium acidophilum]
MATLRLAGKRILLLVSGGIAAYKSLELVRLLRREGAGVRAVLTKGGAEFVTALSLQALCEDRVYTELFSLTDESEMGHIQLSRSADLLVIAPASADLLARMATGQADDLATTVLLATDKPVLAAPAMNVRMWQHPATVANLAILRSRGVSFVGPDEGAMACGEFGPGRLAEPPVILDAISDMLTPRRPLAGRHAIVTSGPTHEAIDPVRYLANRSSGRQGHAIAQALAEAGARVTLISGPVTLPDPPGVTTRHVVSAREMHDAVHAALPAEIAVMCAAVADWHVEPQARKLKKTGVAPTLTLVENPDILADIAHHPARPELVIGFAAETETLLDHAAAKRIRKGCDWILANHVGAGSDVMGGNDNEIVLITQAGADVWPRMSKTEVAARLTSRIIEALK